MSTSPRPPPTSGLLRLLMVPLAVFVLSFSLIPLYRIACEKVLGIRIERGAQTATTAITEINAARMVRVEFDGGVHSRLPWSFHPEQIRMEVIPGKLYEALYIAHNNSAHTVVGSAVPSVSPARASRYFNKIECFCFTTQTLHSGERREMPVRFMIDPDLPADIGTITLSYTFYKTDPL